MRIKVHILLSLFFTLLVFGHAAIPHDHHYQNFIETHTSQQEQFNHCFSLNDALINQVDGLAQVEAINTQQPFCTIPVKPTSWTQELADTYTFSPSLECTITVSPTRGSPIA